RRHNHNRRTPCQAHGSCREAGREPAPAPRRGGARQPLCAEPWAVPSAGGTRHFPRKAAPTPETGPALRPMKKTSRRPPDRHAQPETPPISSEQIESLTEAVSNLTDTVQVLAEILDTLRQEFSWT